LLLSGDPESEVPHLAESVGISEVHAGKSPEEKVAIVKDETTKAETLFVGDGINDAPALTATVGVAFGSQNDITTEAADAVVLEAALGEIDELMHIRYRMRGIALQSALGGMAASMIGMLAAAFGFLPAIWGAVGQELIDLVAVLTRCAWHYQRKTYRITSCKTRYEFSNQISKNGIGKRDQGLDGRFVEGAGCAGGC
jgi:cation transport ATPase